MNRKAKITLKTSGFPVRLVKRVMSPTTPYPSVSRRLKKNLLNREFFSGPDHAARFEELGKRTPPRPLPPRSSPVRAEVLDANLPWAPSLRHCPPRSSLV